MNNEKPYASLTSKEVHEIVTELDNKILEASTNKSLHNILDNAYGTYLAKEIAYMECRNLILSKI
jgi:hypothetical protein